MLISLHKQATTPPKIRAAIQASIEPAWKVAERYGISEQTVWKWRSRNNGMVERFNGRIEDVLQSHHFNSGEDLEQTLLRHVRLYNGQLPQSVLKGQTPIDALKDWQKQRPALFKKRPCNHVGCDK
ncbi:integrase core domain-containing protein [Paracoccus rhizosphaerae]